MKTIALDTNIAIELLNGNNSTIKKLRKYDVFCLPITVCGELLYGAKNSKRKKENEAKFQSFIGQCVILNTNSLIANQYAEIRKDLKEKEIQYQRMIFGLLQFVVQMGSHLQLVISTLKILKA